MTRPRFIAGAVCPTCRAVDRLVVEPAPDRSGEQRRCVACGFTDRRVTSDSVPPAGLRDRARASREVQPVRLLDPTPGTSSED